jgi:hypothetical protein
VYGPSRAAKVISSHLKVIGEVDTPGERLGGFGSVVHGGDALRCGYAFKATNTAVLLHKVAKVIGMRRFIMSLPIKSITS